MKNKKAFTLIEIIVTLILISVIATSTIVAITKEKKDESKALLKTLVEAANVFINIEKDEQGNSFEQGLFYGGTGVFIPVNELYSKGYISDNVMRTLEKDENYIKASENNKAYILAAVFSDNNDECKGNSIIEYKTSWNVNDSDGTQYLCPYQIDDDTLSNIRYIVYDLNGGTTNNTNFKKVNIVKRNETLKVSSITPTKTGYTFNGWKDENGTNYSKEQIIDISITELVLTAQYTKNEVKPTIIDTIKKQFEKNGIAGCRPNLENGLCLSKGTDNTINKETVYYYTGNVTNNYIKLGETLFRIVRTTHDGNVKLVLDEKIEPVVDVKSDYNYTNFMYRHNQVCNYQIISSNNLYEDRYSSNRWVLNNSLYSYKSIKIGYGYSGSSSDLAVSGTSTIYSWSDNTKLTFSGRDDYIRKDVTSSTENYLYKYIYSTVLNWYNSKIVSYQDKLINYNWCDESKFEFNNQVGNYLQPNFTCKNSKQLKYYFGLLTLSEIDSSLYKQETSNSSSGPIDATKSYIKDYYYTLSYDFQRGIYRGRHVLPSYNSCWTSENTRGYGTPIYLNPSIVLKGTEIVSGEGTKQKPYVIE